MATAGPLHPLLAALLGLPCAALRPPARMHAAAATPLPQLTRRSAPASRRQQPLVPSQQQQPERHGGRPQRSPSTTAVSSATPRWPRKPSSPGDPAPISARPQRLQRRPRCLKLHGLSHAPRPAFPLEGGGLHSGCGSAAAGNRRWCCRARAEGAQAAGQGAAAARVQGPLPRRSPRSPAVPAPVRGASRGGDRLLFQVEPPRLLQVPTPACSPLLLLQEDAVAGTEAPRMAADAPAPAPAPGADVSIDTGAALLGADDCDSVKSACDSFRTMAHPEPCRGAALYQPGSASELAGGVNVGRRQPGVVFAARPTGHCTACHSAGYERSMTARSPPPPCCRPDRSSHGHVRPLPHMPGRVLESDRRSRQCHHHM